MPSYVIPSALVSDQQMCPPFTAATVVVVAIASYVIPAHYDFIVRLRIHEIAMRNLIRKVLAKLLFIIFFAAVAVAVAFLFVAHCCCPPLC